MASLRLFMGGEASAEGELEDLLQGLGEVDVLLVGEHHDDPGAHALQFWLLERLLEDPSRSVVLSLEAFERDVQGVMDEYLQGLITEDHFLAASRPWSRYPEAHRPLVELARERGVQVVAANPPRRYVNRVGRLGPDSLLPLPPQARAYLPPLPYPGPSERYREDFSALLAHAASENLVQAQALWDAGMALSVVEALERTPGALVLHIAGSFHVESGTGIPEVIPLYRPGTRLRTVVVRPRDLEGAWEWLDRTPVELPREIGALGDFVVVSPPR